MRQPTQPSVTPHLMRGPFASSSGVSDASARAWMPDQVRSGRRDERGFTLVELMVVIVIIGLLATIVAVNVLPSGDQARVTRAKADINTIGAGLDLYKLQNGRYPTTSEGLAVLVQGGRGYLKGSSVPQDPWGRDYLYASPGQHGEADVWSLGADGEEGGEDTNADIGSWQ